MSKTTRSLLAALEHLGVELKFFTLKDVTVATTALTRSGGDAGKKSARGELLVQSRVQSAGLLALSDLSLHVVGTLLLFLGFGLLGVVLLDANLDTVVLLVPSLERSGIDLHDGVLHQGLGAHQLVVGGVVHDIQNTGLSGGD